jgi:single stranded DNA-binding protein
MWQPIQKCEHCQAVRELPISLSPQTAVIPIAHGVQQDVPEYHNIALFGKLAEIAEQYLKKGNKVYLEGRIQTRSWEDQSGQKKYKTEIVGEQMIMLTPKGGSEWGAHLEKLKNHMKSQQYIALYLLKKKECLSKTFLSKIKTICLPH